MSEKQFEQELREMVEQKVNQLLELARNQMQTYHNMQDSSPTNRAAQVTQKGKIDALERLEAKIKEIKTEGRLLHPPHSKVIGIRDYLGNENKYLNAVYMTAINIRDHRRRVDGSNTSSSDGERGKFEAMEEVMRYIERIEVLK